MLSLYLLPIASMKSNREVCASVCLVCVSWVAISCSSFALSKLGEILSIASTSGRCICAACTSVCGSRIAVGSIFGIKGAYHGLSPGSCGNAWHRIGRRRATGALLRLSQEILIRWIWWWPNKFETLASASPVMVWIGMWVDLRLCRKPARR